MDTHQLSDLLAAQRVAHAAWSAAPEKTRAEKARKSDLSAALSAAATAVAAAKRAEAPAATVVSAAINAAIARQAAAEDRAALVRRVKAAAGRYMWAQEFPRHGQGWPETASEREDDALLRAHGASVLGHDWSE